MTNLKRLYIFQNYILFLIHICDYYFISRLILVMNPLHYKRIITKSRIHKIYAVASFIFLIDLVIGFTFFRQDAFIRARECAIQFILHPNAFIIRIVVFVVLTIAMLISYVILSIKLRGNAMASKNSVRGNNLKLTYASWITLTFFLLLYLPSTLLAVATNFLGEPYPLYILVPLDISYLLYYMNNVVNPFIYFSVLKDFREGYKSVLCCEGKKEISSGMASSFRNSSTYLTDRTATSSISTCS